MRRENYRKIPLKSILRPLGTRAHGLVGVNINVPFLASPSGPPGQKAVIAASEDDIGVFRMRRYPARFAASDGEPIGRRDGISVRPRGDTNRRIILLGAVDVVGKIVVG